MLEGEHLKHFETLSTQGHAAKEVGEHERALTIFNEADLLAQQHNDDLKRLHALTPGARAEWSLGRYSEATEKLHTVQDLALELGLEDERGITISNIGRIAAVRTVRSSAPSQQQVAKLRGESVSHFRRAHTVLSGHPHLYYRYANAQHGSVIAALAGKRVFASRLVAEGLSVAFRKSEEPYDQQRTYQINKRGLAQFAAAALLIPFGNRTPILAKAIRRKFIR